MAIFRNIKRETRRWFLDLIHEPGWSPGVARVGAAIHASIVRLARISMPGLGSSDAWRDAGRSVWVPIRQILLTCSAVASVGVLIALVSHPLWASTGPQLNPFPAEMILGGLRPVDPAPREPEVARSPRAEAVARYEYSFGSEGRPLTVEVRFFQQAKGDVASYTQARLEHRPALQLRTRIGLGEYAWFEHDHRLWLTACVDIHGLATVQPGAFDRNRRLHDRHWMRSVRWIFGLGPLEDRRAMWTLISLQSDATSSPEALNLLEQVLFDTALLWRDNWAGTLVAGKDIP
jgi:cyanosortase A-associated protein